MPTLPASAQVVATQLQQMPRDRPAPARVGTAVLKGRVVDGVTGAAVARARVRLQGEGVRPSVLTDVSGGFMFSELPSGGYSVFAEKSTYLSAVYPERGRTIRSASRPATLANGQVATITVPITVGAGATASGRVVFDGTSAPPSDPKQMRLMLFTSDGMTCRSPQIQLDADWRFRIDGIHGTCLGTQSFTIDRWMLKAIMHEGQNLIDRPTTFETGQQLRNVELVFTDRRSELTFEVSDRDAQRTREYVALVFSADRLQWEDSSSLVRTFTPPPIEITTTRGGVPTTSGGQPQIGMPPPHREALSGLRPGEYLVVAVDDIAFDDTRDSTVLGRLASRATRVTLGDGATVEVPLRRYKLADVLR